MKSALYFLILIMILLLPIDLIFAQVETETSLRAQIVPGGVVVGKTLIEWGPRGFLGFRYPVFKTALGDLERRNCLRLMSLIVKKADKLLQGLTSGSQAQSGAQAFRNFFANKIKTDCKSVEDLADLYNELIAAISNGVAQDIAAGKISLDFTESIIEATLGVTAEDIKKSFESGSNDELGKSFKNLINALKQAITFKDSAGNKVDAGKAAKSFKNAGTALEAALAKQVKK